MTTLTDSYRYWRQRSNRAADAIAKARADAAEGKRRYPFSSTAPGAPFDAYGSRMRWIEKPSAVGLRFVGLAHDVAKRNYSYAYGIDHTGWFLDDFQDETVSGAVYQLPGRGGHARYVAGYADPWNGSPDKDGPACIALDEIFEGDPGEESASCDHGARDCAYRADQIAEIMAEREREFLAAHNARMRFDDLGDEIADTRKTALELIADIKERKASLCDGPAIVAALRARIESALETIADAREKRRDLLADYGSHEGWTL